MIQLGNSCSPGWFWFGRGGREGCPGTTDNVPLKQLYILPFSFSQKHPPFSVQQSHHAACETVKNGSCAMPFTDSAASTIVQWPHLLGSVFFSSPRSPNGKSRVGSPGRGKHSGVYPGHFEGGEPAFSPRGLACGSAFPVFSCGGGFSLGRGGETGRPKARSSNVPRSHNTLPY